MSEETKEEFYDRIGRYLEESLAPNEGENEWRFGILVQTVDRPSLSLMVGVLPAENVVGPRVQSSLVRPAVGTLATVRRELFSTRITLDYFCRIEFESVSNCFCDVVVFCLVVCEQISIGVAKELLATHLTGLVVGCVSSHWLASLSTSNPSSTSFGSTRPVWSPCNSIVRSYWVPPHPKFDLSVEASPSRSTAWSNPLTSVTSLYFRSSTVTDTVVWSSATSSQTHSSLGKPHVVHIVLISYTTQ